MPVLKSRRSGQDLRNHPMVRPQNDENQQTYLLLAEALDHMDLKPTEKEFAKAVLRAAIEYATMRRAGFVLGKPEKSAAR